jgi:ATP-dependent Lon protease
LFEVILPLDNEKDLAEVPENLRSAMKMHFVDTMDQVLQIALVSPLPSLREEETARPIAPLTSGTEDSPAAHQ